MWSCLLRWRKWPERSLSKWRWFHSHKGVAFWKTHGSSVDPGGIICGLAMGMQAAGMHPWEALTSAMYAGFWHISLCSCGDGRGCAPGCFLLLQCRSCLPRLMHYQDQFLWVCKCLVLSRSQHYISKCNISKAWRNPWVYTVGRDESSACLYCEKEILCRVWLKD